jgi:hypothetical protein
MSVITGDDDDEVREEFNSIVDSVRECVDRGDGLNPCHVYLDGSGECQCKRGPRLDERRMM